MQPCHAVVFYAWRQPLQAAMNREHGRLSMVRDGCESPPLTTFLPILLTMAGEGKSGGGGLVGKGPSKQLQADHDGLANMAPPQGEMAPPQGEMVGRFLHTLYMSNYNLRGITAFH